MRAILYSQEELQPLHHMLLLPILRGGKVGLEGTETNEPQIDHAPLDIGLRRVSMLQIQGDLSILEP